VAPDALIVKSSLGPQLVELRVPWVERIAVFTVTGGTPQQLKDSHLIRGVMTPGARRPGFCFVTIVRLKVHSSLVRLVIKRNRTTLSHHIEPDDGRLYSFLRLICAFLRDGKPGKESHWCHQTQGVCAEIQFDLTFHAAPEANTRKREQYHCNP